MSVCEIDLLRSDLCNSGSSDSDSDNDEWQKLKEATADSELLTLGILPSDGRSKKKPSLRPVEKSHDEENVLCTTPEFRAHVAKKLMKFIDSQIDESDTWPDNTQRYKQDEENTEDMGCRLFSMSSLTKDKEFEENQIESCSQQRKRRVSSSSDSSDTEVRCAAVAVSGLQILSQGALYNHTNTPQIDGLLTKSNIHDEEELSKIQRSKPTKRKQIKEKQVNGDHGYDCIIDETSGKTFVKSGSPKCGKKKKRDKEKLTLNTDNDNHSGNDKKVDKIRDRNKDEEKMGLDHTSDNIDVYHKKKHKKKPKSTRK